MPNPNQKPQQGPDPAVQEAIQRLVQTQLSPLEEVIFKSWMEANQIEEKPEAPFDYRGLYKQTDGKVFAPGELSGKIDHKNAIQTLMGAQEQHDAASPMKAFQDAQGGGQDMGLDMDAAAQGDEFYGGADPGMGGEGQF